MLGTHRVAPQPSKFITRNATNVNEMIKNAIVYRSKSIKIERQQALPLGADLAGGAAAGGAAAASAAGAASASAAGFTSWACTRPQLAER